MRLPEGYEPFIASNVADAKNFSPDHARFDLIVGATFLRPFVGDRR